MRLLKLAENGNLKQGLKPGNNAINERALKSKLELQTEKPVDAKVKDLKAKAQENTAEIDALKETIANQEEELGDKEDDLRKENKKTIHDQQRSYIRVVQETKAANEYAKKRFEELREEGEAQDAELEQLREEAAKHNKSVNSLRKQLQEA